MKHGPKLRTIEMVRINGRTFGVRNGQLYAYNDRTNYMLVMCMWADGMLAEPDAMMLHRNDYVSKHKLAHEVLEQYEDELVDYRVEVAA